NIIRFVDGKFVATLRPTDQQEVYYSGYKKRHGILFQAITTLDGMIAYLSPAYPGSSNDAGQARSLDLYGRLQAQLKYNNNQNFVYGDSAYSLCGGGLSPYHPDTPHETLSPAIMINFNSTILSHRILIENSFAYIGQYFSQFKNTTVQHISQTDPHIIFTVCVLLRNSLVILNGWKYAYDKYNVSPPSLDEYFIQS
ncbi:hypothetical protein COEREDRAFT_43082, partial [Coemansia reversa NRRL 1564]